MRISTLAIVSALLLPSAAQAATYVASLSGSQEVPAVVTTGTGFSKLVVSGNKLTVSVSFADLSGPLQAGHIHCCTTGPDQNVGVAIGFTVPNVATGMFDLMFNLASETTYTMGFLAGGTAEMARDRLIAGFDSGNSYVNLHTTANPRGEIRGQISAIPEASTWVMLISGFGLVGAAMRRRTATARPALQN